MKWVMLAIPFLGANIPECWLRLAECWCESYILCGVSLVGASCTPKGRVVGEMHNSWESSLIWIRLWPVHWLGRGNSLCNGVMKVRLQGIPPPFSNVTSWILISQLWNLQPYSSSLPQLLPSAFCRLPARGSLLVHVPAAFVPESSRWVLGQRSFQRGRPQHYPSPGSRCVAAGRGHQRHRAALVWGGACEFAVLKSCPGSTDRQRGVELLGNTYHPGGPPSVCFFLMARQSRLLQAALTSLPFAPVNAMPEPFCCHDYHLLLVHVFILPSFLAHCFPKAVFEYQSWVSSQGKKKIYIAYYLLLWELHALAFLKALKVKAL